jgi:hypothetical protein
MDGCCSVGVVLRDEEEAMTIVALAATLGPGAFEHADQEGGLVERRGARWATRVVDGACVFLNRPGFAGGAGCALHLGALADGDDPLDWKPQTCGRVPIEVDERPRDAADPDGGVEVTVRVWRRDDWGPGGATIAWWCTDAPEAFTADEPVADSMAEVLRRLMGDDVYPLARTALRQSGQQPA